MVLRRNILIMFGLLLLLTMCNPTPSYAGCIMSYCQDEEPTKRIYITNTHRQKVGDLYIPGHGQRIQIRDTHRRIVGYLDTNGSITNINRQKIGVVNGR